ncbi:hypothetical protein ZWY2020_047064 [Hordeum vulgare]|nr:hypothetical protein ZWY2020_047064 [Hordeum vulgare]
MPSSREHTFCSVGRTDLESPAAAAAAKEGRKERAHAARLASPRVEPAQQATDRIRRRVVRGGGAAIRIAKPIGSDRPGRVTLGSAGPAGLSRATQAAEPTPRIVGRCSYGSGIAAFCWKEK